VTGSGRLGSDVELLISELGIEFTHKFKNRLIINACTPAARVLNSTQSMSEEEYAMLHNLEEH
jgi:hypothetical protein